jgi:hypothetical protein
MAAVDGTAKEARGDQMTEDSPQPQAAKRELIKVLLLTTATAVLLLAFYLPGRVRESWPICRKVASERECMIYHARGEFFSDNISILCGPGGDLTVYKIHTSYGREWKFKSTE